MEMYDAAHFTKKKHKSVGLGQRRKANKKFRWNLLSNILRNGQLASGS